MKFEITDAFRADLKRLSEHERRLVAEVLPTFVAACYGFAADPGATRPASLRVRDVEGARGVLEMTWSFSGPDGRATFEWIRIEGELAVRWLRIGGHSVVSEGRSTAAKASLRALPPPVSVEGPSASSLLQQMREEERSL